VAHARKGADFLDLNGQVGGLIANDYHADIY
jgi:hypothetical protein